jgi:hypothetical protein
MAINKETANKVRSYSTESMLMSAMALTKDQLEKRIGEALEALHEQRHCAPLDPEVVDWGVSFSPAAITGSLSAHHADIGVRLEVFLDAALALELATSTAMADLQQIDEVHQIEPFPPVKSEEERRAEEGAAFADACVARGFQILERKRREEEQKPSFDEIPF